MTFKEFKNAVEDWGEKYGYKPVIEVDFNYVNIGLEGDGYPDIICEIHKTQRCVINLNWTPFRNLSENEKEELYKITTEFAATKPEDREDKKDNLDLIINRLEVIQTNAEDVMNWTIQEIQERSWSLRNTLEDIIIDLEEYQEANGEVEQVNTSRENNKISNLVDLNIWTNDSFQGTLEELEESVEKTHENNKF